MNGGTSLAREALIKRLRDYQDWSGIHVVVVFDGKGAAVSESSDPGDMQIFYSRDGQTADTLIERLASKYASQFRILVATSDFLEQETVGACGAECITPEALRGLLEEARSRGTGLGSAFKQPIARGVNCRESLFASVAGRWRGHGKARSKVVRSEDSC